MRTEYTSDKCCQVERGLWTPELCAKKAELACSQCQRPICTEHQKQMPQSGEILCVPCYVKNLHTQATNSTPNPYAYQDPAWYYYERMRYHQMQNQRNFDIQDYHAFNYSSTDYTSLPEEYTDRFFDS